MADEILRSKHAFGSSQNIEKAISDGKIDAFDILFLDSNTDNPKIGWLDKDGNVVLVRDEKADLSGVEADIDNLETGLTDLELVVGKKADADEVDAKISEVESTLSDVIKSSHALERIKYEITDVPIGTIVDYRDNEIRIMCKENAVWSKQNVGTGGDPNAYYCTFKTYVPSDDVVGYIEHLGGQVDNEVLTTFSTDEYGRKYQPTWLALAKYDDASGTWNYYGKNSANDNYIGWDYQIDWYNADGIMIASDCIRINLSNENCHSSIEPYYVGEIKKEIDEKIEEKIDEKIADIEFAWEIVEF